MTTCPTDLLACHAPCTMSRIGPLTCSTFHTYLCPYLWAQVEYNSLSWKDCRLVVGLENKEDFCQWVGAPSLASFSSGKRCVLACYALVFPVGNPCPALLGKHGTFVELLSLHSCTHRHWQVSQTTPPWQLSCS